MKMRNISFFSIVITVFFFASGNIYGIEVNLNGADKKSYDLIKKTVSYKRLSELKSSDGVSFWMRRLRRDAQTGLQALGYYEANISAELNQNKDSVNLLIQLGKPIIVTKVVIEIPSRALKEVKYPLRNGDQLEHATYEQGKQILHAWLLANGYLKANLVTHRMEINKKKHTAEIKLSWETGPQYKFGLVTFEDNKLSHEFLKRYIPFLEGETFTEIGLQKLSDQLRNSGYFASIDIVPQLEKTDDLNVPILVRLQPLKRTAYELGLSMGTDQGAGIEADINRRRSNIKGHNWKLKSELTTQRFLLGGQYEIPSKKDINSTRRIGLSYIDETTDSSNRESFKGTFSKQRLYRKWQRIDSISVLDEKYTIADVTEKSTNLIISTDLSRTKSKNPINPNQGWRARLSLSGASDALGSATDFIRTEADYKQISSLNDKTRLIARTRLGALWVDDFNQLPASLRFFAGGDRSVRGFDFEELGPTDDVNNVLGGQYVATASVEMDYLIKPSWRIATFIDAGNAFGSGREDIEYSAGIGARWLSPIGPVRLDFANALSTPEKSWRVHFSIGPDL